MAKFVESCAIMHYCYCTRLYLKQLLCPRRVSDWYDTLLNGVHIVHLTPYLPTATYSVTSFPPIISIEPKKKVHDHDHDHDVRHLPTFTPHIIL